MTAAELTALYDAHSTALFGCLLALTGCEADARDALQETFVRLARLPQGAADTFMEPRAFLVTMARRTAIDLARRAETRRKYHRLCAEETPRLFDDPAPADAAVCRDALETAIASLPPEQRAVTVMHLWAGLTFQQIAQALEIPANTAASRFRYALTKLRPLLQPLYDEIR